jgi:hypothetical protein
MYMSKVCVTPNQNVSGPNGATFASLTNACGGYVTLLL